MTWSDPTSSNTITCCCQPSGLDVRAPHNGDNVARQCQPRYRERHARAGSVLAVAHRLASYVCTIALSGFITKGPRRWMRAECIAAQHTTHNRAASLFMHGKRSRCEAMLRGHAQQSSLAVHPDEAHTRQEIKVNRGIECTYPRRWCAGRRRSTSRDAAPSAHAVQEEESRAGHMRRACQSGQ